MVNSLEEQAPQNFWLESQKVKMNFTMKD